ncbi:iron-containing alcohol dehydrogenase family protein [Fervidobacterium thailandense]|uniref:Alcohol dehydrogenase n=1 Tax=Fervidobacterium thailandense TaxID=1008305 RepID=A0A1E3G1I2_9BACT|nr:iron-containing alcohol dehydrogenase family protein [Fervidobacterium thailandense]ODN30111.1 alcohol dehydrogenase [Fervidobacterium thailandense]
MGFYMPTKVLYGKDVVLKNRELIQSLGERFLIVTGKSSKKNGSLDDVLDVLDGKHVTVYDETPENPPTTVVEEIAKMFTDVDVVVGVGGGSPMDTAKAVAVLLENPSLTAQDLYDTGKYTRAKPIICVPTTAGTGSEVTQYSVLILNGRKRGFSHECIFPKIAFVDYKYTLTASEELTLSTALDALSHAVEGFISLRATPFSDVLAVESVKLIKEFLPKVLNDPENEFYRERLMFASTLAGMVIAQTGTTIAHALGYSLTTEKNVKHGLATAVFLPFELKVANNEKSKFINELFDGSIMNFYEQVGVKLPVAFSDEEIETWANIVLSASHLKVTPGEYTLERIKEAYEFVRSNFCF